MQKAEIQEKTNDILDSIKYAERIQTAILPTEETLSHLFEGEHFVLYKPKDIVSGDFYWADRFDNQAIFAAVDCTGHGVPGAFVSIVGFNGLNRTVNEFNLRKPGDILDKLTELVVSTFAKSESQIKDGMDIALCNINYNTNTLTFSGANNPCVIIRNGELIELKANKQPIGEFHNRVPFSKFGNKVLILEIKNMKWNFKKEMLFTCSQMVLPISLVVKKEKNSKTRP